MVTKRIMPNDENKHQEKINARKRKKRYEKEIDEYLIEQSYLKESLEELKMKEIISRYKEELNLQYKNEISLMTKRIKVINTRLVELRKLIKKLKVWLKDPKLVSIHLLTPYVINNAGSYWYMHLLWNQIELTT